MKQIIIGLIKFPKNVIVDWTAITLLCNLVRKTGCKVDFQRGRIIGEQAVLPFVVSNTSVLDTIKEYFSECEIVTQKKILSYSDKQSLKLATQLNSITDKTQVIKENIEPRSELGLLNMIGREKEISQLKAITNAVKAYGRSGCDSLHMLFTGNPGTGKTMLARSLLEFYDKQGVTSGRGVFVQADATTLISPYLGETSVFVKNAFSSAEGGILFVDEAYRLCRQNTGTNGNNYGVEAIDALNQCMEEMREQVIVILAGYKPEMEMFMKLNPGLRDRIGFEIHFDDYSDQKLLDIFQQMARDRRLKVHNDALDVLAMALPQLKSQEGFANARTMRKLMLSAIVGKAEMGNLDDVLSASDLQNALRKCFKTEKKQTIGFVH